MNTLLPLHDRELLHPSATSFTELALLYNPNMSPKSARRILHDWIRLNAALSAELISLGWTVTVRWLTPRQVHAFYTYLGQP